MSAVCNNARWVGEWAAKYRAAAMRICRPWSQLPHARLKHLIGVKTGILTEQRVRERRNQRFGWVTEDEMAGN